MSDKEELSKLRGSHKVYGVSVWSQCMESPETEIQALLCRFDIQKEMNIEMNHVLIKRNTKVRSKK